MTVTTAPNADAGTKDRIEIKVGNQGHFVELDAPYMPTDIYEKNT